MAATSYLVFATTSLLTLSLAQITVLLTQASDAVVVATDFFDSNSTGVFTFMSTTTTPTAITPNSASTTPGFIGGIATLTSATTTTSPSQSTSDSTAKANLAAASSGLASSVKVGIGLGVPRPNHLEHRRFPNIPTSEASEGFAFEVSWQNCR